MTSRLTVRAVDRSRRLEDANWLYEVEVPIGVRVRAGGTGTVMVRCNELLAAQLDDAIRQLDSPRDAIGDTFTVVGPGWILARLAYVALVRATAALGADLVRADAGKLMLMSIEQRGAAIEELLDEFEQIDATDARWR
ncbi:hypothetical protein Q5424_05770 [Conexibacter sp. JD483]|uniref:hypothetical protein n=1 Tax=unclassified Conexibacter TaxID=2627773 RepID=UPI002722CF82|nr:MULTISPECIES: hypothetical protein [unclassified Conexibacter]MDO8185968.1 hypothetical protein [Conexibacter sp. CPCC 205706]MDO8199459.1 hypothetical protein [Conexibacter sp. CPCC 205762]MDR9368577.1 hypothetical protein [Conexibacter sp. JD483]